MKNNNPKWAVLGEWYSLKVTTRQVIPFVRFFHREFEAKRYLEARLKRRNVKHIWAKIIEVE